MAAPLALAECEYSFVLTAFDSMQRRVGTFQSLSQHGKAAPCTPAGVSLTHTFNNDKSSFQAVWTPPVTGHGNVSVKATVVPSTTAYYQLQSTLTQIIQAVAPEPPSSAQLVSTSNDTMTISWTPGVNLGSDVLEYKVVDAASSTQLYSGAQSQATLTSLTPDTLYTLQLSARNANGWSSTTLSVQYRTLPTGAMAPDQPDEVTVLALGPSFATVGWTVCHRLLSYEVVKLYEL